MARKVFLLFISITIASVGYWFFSHRGGQIYGTDNPVRQVQIENLLIPNVATPTSQAYQVELIPPSFEGDGYTMELIPILPAEEPRIQLIATP